MFLLYLCVLNYSNNMLMFNLNMCICVEWERKIKIDNVRVNKCEKALPTTLWYITIDYIILYIFCSFFFLSCMFFSLYLTLLSLLSYFTWFFFLFFAFFLFFFFFFVRVCVCRWLWATMNTQVWVWIRTWMLIRDVYCMIIDK